jgi:hypothetical protein
LIRQNPVDRFPIVAEAMEMDVARASPVAELDPELIGSSRLAQEFMIVDAEHGVELTKDRNAGFANTDDPDLFGFDERDGNADTAELPGQQGSRHPACRTPAEDRYRSYRITGHLLLIRLAQGAC